MNTRKKPNPIETSQRKTPTREERGSSELKIQEAGQQQYADKTGKLDSRAQSHPKEVKTVKAN